jgi:hypothetical protein
MKITANFEKQTYQGITINLVKNQEWGWYISLSDGYESDYFQFKKEAKQRIAQIKSEIKSKSW